MHKGRKPYRNKLKKGRVGKSCPGWVIVGNKLCRSYIVFEDQPQTIWQNLFVLNEFVHSLWLVFRASIFTTSSSRYLCVICLQFGNLVKTWTHFIQDRPQTIWENSFVLNEFAGSLWLVF